MGHRTLHALCVAFGVLEHMRTAMLLVHISQYVAGVLRCYCASVLTVQVVVLLHMHWVQHMHDGVDAGVRGRSRVGRVRRALVRHQHISVAAPFGYAVEADAVVKLQGCVHVFVLVHTEVDLLHVGLVIAKGLDVLHEPTAVAARRWERTHIAEVGVIAGGRVVSAAIVVIVHQAGAADRIGPCATPCEN